MSLKPLNIQEHKSAFTKFLIFFFITLAMAASALYFDFKIPQKELKLLRDRSDLLRKQNIAQDNYKKLLNEAMSVLSKLDSSNVNKAMVQSDFQPIVSALTANVNIDDSTSSQRLNRQVIVLLNLYADAKLKLVDSKSCREELEKEQKKYVDAQTALENLRRNIEVINTQTPLRQ